MQGNDSSVMMMATTNIEFVEYITNIFCNFKANTIYIYFDQESNLNIAPHIISSTMVTECTTLIIVKYILVLKQLYQIEINTLDFYLFHL